MPYKKMNRDHKKEWMRRLRSGDYEQANGALRKELEDGTLGYCCLGVAADTLKDDLGLDWQRGCEGALYYEIDGEAETLSDRLKTTVGLSEHAEEALIHLNDNACLDFKQIAAWISKNL